MQQTLSPLNNILMKIIFLTFLAFGACQFKKSNDEKLNSTNFDLSGLEQPKGIYPLKTSRKETVFVRGGDQPFVLVKFYEDCPEKFAALKDKCVFKEKSSEKRDFITNSFVTAYNVEKGKNSLIPIYIPNTANQGKRLWSAKIKKVNDSKVKVLFSSCIECDDINIYSLTFFFDQQRKKWVAEKQIQTLQ